jgi:hypothetical protein
MFEFDSDSLEHSDLKETNNQKTNGRGRDYGKHFLGLFRNGGKTFLVIDKEAWDITGGGFEARYVELLGFQYFCLKKEQKTVKRIILFNGEKDLKGVGGFLGDMDYEMDKFLYWLAKGLKGKDAFKNLKN